MPGDNSVPTTPHVILDRENPWPGLATFEEQNHLFFHGRSRELARLVGMVERATVTLIYGKSGLGKSSLINAGLFVELRRETRPYLPIPVTLKFSTAQSQEGLALDHLVQQVKDHIAEALTISQVDARPPLCNETLYEYFHRDDIDFWDKRNHPLIPVLVFDQFEEIFTIGASDEITRARTEYFLQELAALAEGNHTEPVLRRFREHPEAKAACNFDKRDFKLVLSIREDFLPHLKDREKILPSVFQKEQGMYLKEMSRDQALEVVNKPGGQLLAPGVAEQIVDFVIGPGRSENTDGNRPAMGGKRGVDPSILSLVCKELNEKRKLRQQQSGKPERIESEELATGQAEQIIERYYRDSVSQLPALRSFIEQGLVTRDGHRSALPEADAMAREGVRIGDIDFLVRNRRVLIREIEDGERWLRLSHDRLAAVARQTRAERELEEQRLMEESRRKEAEEKQREAEVRQQEAEERECVTERLRAKAVAAEIRTRKALRRSIFLSVVAFIGLVLAILSAREAWVSVKRARRSERQTRKSEQLAKTSEQQAKDSARKATENQQIADAMSQQAIASEGRAVENEHLATGRLVDSLEEAGRKELLAGEPDRALVYLSEANKIKSGAPTLNFLVSRALAPIHALVATCGGHADAVTSAGFSHDGKLLFTVSPDSTAKIWETKNGRLLTTIDAHVDSITEADFSPDGRRIVLASSDHTASVCDVASGKELFRLRGHFYSVNAICFSPDGSSIASAGSDRNVIIWNATTGESRQVLVGHSAEVWAVTFSADGQRVVSASSDKTAKIWDVESGRLLHTLGGSDGHTLRLMSAEFSPDGHGEKVLTVSADGSAKLWDSESGKLLFTFAPAPETHAPCCSGRFSRDGSRILIATSDGNAQVWSAESGELLETVRASSAGLNSAAFSSDGSVFVTAGAEGVAKLWDSRSGVLLFSFRGGQKQILSVTFSDDGEQLVTCGSEGTAKIWSLAGAGIPRTLEHHGQLEMAAFSPDGKRVVTASRDNTARLWDPATGKPVGPPLSHGDYWVIHAAFSPDGKQLVTVGGNTAKVWKTSDGTPFLRSDGTLMMLPGKSSKTFASFSQDGKSIITGDVDGFWTDWNAKTGDLLMSAKSSVGRISTVGFHPYAPLVLAAGRDAAGRNVAQLWRAWNGKFWIQYDYSYDALCASFSPDGSRVAVGTRGGLVKIYDILGSAIRSIPAHNDRVLSLTFNQDGTLLMTTSADKTAKVWNMQTGMVVASLDGHTAEVRSAAFGPGGVLAVTASDDKTAKVWDVTSGKLLASLAAHADAVTSAVFNHDGTQILTASRDGTAKLWDLRSATEDPNKIESLVTKQIPFHLESGRLLPGSPADGSLAYNLNAEVLRTANKEPEKQDILQAGRYEEQGRLSLLAGDPGAALVWLNEAYRHGANWFSEEFLLGKTLPQLHGLRSVARANDERIENIHFSPDEKSVATASLDRTATILDVQTGKPRLRLVGHTDWVFVANFSPDSKRVVTAGRDGTARIWNAANGRQILFLDHDAARARDENDEKLAEDLFVERAIGEASFSPDGKLVLTSCADGIARLWDGESGRYVRPLRHRANLYTAKFSPDGTKVVTAARNGSVKLWDTAQGHEIAPVEGHSDLVADVEFSPSGTLFATASNDGSAKVWSSADGSLVAKFQHRDKVNMVCFSPDGKRLLTASLDQTAKVWDIREKRAVVSLDEPAGQMEGAKFSPDGKLIVTASDDRVRKISEATTAQLNATLGGHTNNWICANFSLDGRVAVTASGDTVRIWDASTKSVDALRVQEFGQITSALFDPQRSRVVVLLRDGAEVKIADAVDNSVPIPLKTINSYFTINRQKPVHSLAILPVVNAPPTPPQRQKTTGLPAPAAEATQESELPEDELSNAFTDPLTERLIAEMSTLPDLRTTNKEAVSSYKYADPVAAGRALKVDAVLLAKITRKWDKDSRHWSDNFSLNIEVVDPSDGSLRWRSLYTFSKSGLLDSPHVIAGDILKTIDLATDLSSDGSRVITGTADGITTLWNAQDGKSLRTFPKLSSGITFLSFSPNEEKYATITADDTVYVSDAVSGDLVRAFQNIHRDKVTAATLSSDAKLLVTTSQDKTAKIWNVADGSSIAILSGHRGNVSAARFNVDGTKVVTASEDKTAKIWEVATGKLLVTLSDHSGPVNDAQFSPDGNTVVTVGDDARGLVWDVATGKLLYRFERHSAPVSLVAFSPDSKRVITGDRSGVLWAWELAREIPPPSEVQDLTRRFVPYAIKDGQLLPAQTIGTGYQ